jgi:transposase
VEQRAAAVALFEIGFGDRTVAYRLGVSRYAVRRLYQRWKLRGSGALVVEPTKQSFSFEVKAEVVRRFMAGEPALSLAQEFGLSSPLVVRRWARIVRDEGVDGLRPKPKGRPRAAGRDGSVDDSELARLRRENARLRAEVAYLGKLRALKEQEQR